jgi:hypothetical protein
MKLYWQFKKASSTYQAYIVATFLGMLGLIATSKFLAIPDGYRFAVLGASLAGFAFGFVSWSLPWLRIFWHHAIGRVILLALNVLVLLLSTALARNIVAAAIGLPPQDFEMSVGFIALAMYPLGWCLVVAVPVAFLVLAFQLAAFLQGMLGGLRNRTAASLSGHCLGTFALLMAMAMVAEGYSTVQKHIYPAVRWIAFFSDYQIAPAYPGVHVGERIRLHENGVISFPVIENGMLSIRTRKYN